MSSRPVRAVAFVLVLLFASMSPLALHASAHQSILLSTDSSHIMLMGGDSGNITLTIENNASAIETYNISVDTTGLSAVWDVIASEETVENVFPTWSKNTTIIVRLSEGALPSDSGSFDIIVTEPDQNISSSITVYVSVSPSYLPSLNLSPMGGALTVMDSGSNATFSIDVENLGSVEDTLLLDVEYEPDLAAWWANYTNGSGNNSGNNTGGNGTGGNGSGNGTGGNGTGGNGTGGNISQVWSTPVTLDSTYNVGEHSSLAIDSNDHLHVTYLDYTSLNLEYMTYDGSSWSTPVSLDSTNHEGYDSSLAIDSNDNLHVTYCDLTYDNLEYTTYDGSSWSTPVSLDSTGDVGAMSSLAIDSNDHLHVTYLDSTNGNLEYMTYDGFSWSTPVSLDSGWNVGAMSSLAIDSNDNLHVTYLDEVNDNLEYVTYDGSSWSLPLTLDRTDDVGYDSSLAIDSNDNLYVTYYDYTNGNLEYKIYDGSSWSTSASLDSTDDVGEMSSLAIDSNDHLHVTYRDYTNGNLEYMTYDGFSWSTPVSLDSTDNVGAYSSLAIDSNDNLHVTYYDNTNANLEYMFSSNSAGGNNTGGNGSGSGGNNTTIISNVLMFGNSYTSFNSLHSILESLGISNADALTGGGKTLAGHWSDVNSSHVSNTTLRDANIDWDYVILQDQSQIPGYYRTNADWIASKDGAVDLAGAITEEGGESILLMTWGRRNGDAMNPTLYPNFTVMQERLESGYMDYQSNMTNGGNTVWMAPVGLAFAHIHDSVVASGLNATLSGNTFYELYNADGSHPSLAGSYLAACVLYATMTGDSPVGSNDTVSLSATLKLELQQAAAATVFNETSHIAYPWEVTGTATSSMMMSSPRGLGGGIPAGWNVQWMDDEFANMPAGSSQSASLQISVPSNAAPDYYGFRLFSASTGGNVSTSTMLVIHVDEEHNLSLAFLEQNELFIPGQSTETSIQITNSGNAVVDYDWTLSVLNGPCSAALVTASTPSVAPDDVLDVGFQITVHSEATKTDSCSLQLNGIGTSASEQHSTAPFDFTVDVDELVLFSLISPLGDLELTPGTPVSYEIRVQNNGSETVTFYLDVDSTNGLSTTLDSSSGVSVSAGEAGVWSLSSDADAGESGIMSQSFSVSYAGLTVEESVDIEVLGVHSATLTGPLDGRVLVRPGETVLTSFTLENTGTSNLSLVAGLIGLPAEAEATLSHTSVELAVGESVAVDITLTIATSSQAGTHSLTFAYGSSELSVETSLSLQIQERIAVLMSSTGSRIVAGPSSNAIYSFDVTNLGTASDTLHLSLSENGASDWFDFELSSTSLLLEAGQSSTVTLNVREISQGAPISGAVVSLLAHSSSDESISSHINLSVESLIAGAEILVLSDDDSAEPNGEIHGTVVVTNTGTGLDQLLLSTVGLDCGISTVLSLEAGESSSALPWSCLLPSDAEAGLSELKFRVTSSSRTSFSASSSEIYTVEPVWGSSGVLQVTFAQSSLMIPSSGGSTVMVSVTNLANAQVTGLLSLEGIGDGLLATEWVRYSDNTSSNEFALSPGSTAEYSLTLMSLVSTSESATLSIRASYQIGDTASSDLSNQLNVEIEGPALPPNGVRLPLGMELSQSDSLNALFGGWGVAILLLGVLYLSRNKKQNSLLEEEDDVEEEVDEEKETPLGFNECRMDEGKVSCPSCEARLGVPRGSEAPFRFTCPKCSTMIRVVE